MKKTIYSLFLLLCAVLISCQPDKEDIKKPNNTNVPESIVAKLQKAGFDTSEGLFRYKNGYMVEYDILLTETQIDDLINSKANAKNARVEHYRTNNLVTGTPRTLGVFMDTGFGNYMQNAFDLALARYNAQNLSLSFQRVSSSAAASISIISFYEVSNVLG